MQYSRSSSYTREERKRHGQGSKKLTLCPCMRAGKYTPGGMKAQGPRAGMFSDDRLRAVQPLLGLMRDVGSAHGGKTCAQVAINWTICKGALPIPGAPRWASTSCRCGELGYGGLCRIDHLHRATHCRPCAFQIVCCGNGPACGWGPWKAMLKYCAIEPGLQRGLCHDLRVRVWAQAPRMHGRRRRRRARSAGA